MSHYQAPLADMSFQLFDVWQVQQFWQQQAELAELIDTDTAAAILEEAAKITAEKIAPLAAAADEQGVSCVSGEVTTPSHYKECYQLLCEGGWTGLSGDPEVRRYGHAKKLVGFVR